MTSRESADHQLGSPAVDTAQPCTPLTHYNHQPTLASCHAHPEGKHIAWRCVFEAACDQWLRKLAGLEKMYHTGAKIASKKRPITSVRECMNWRNYYALVHRSTSQVDRHLACNYTSFL